MKKIGVVLKGSVSRQDPSFTAQLYDITTKCTLRVAWVNMAPNFPAGGVYLNLVRQFQISSNLISRPTISGGGIIHTEETPLMLFLQETSRVNRGQHQNPSSDYFNITSPSTYPTFRMEELLPLPANTEEDTLNYWYTLNIFLILEIPD